MALGAPLRSKQKMESIAADARGSAVSTSKRYQDVPSHQRRRRSTHEITRPGHINVHVNPPKNAAEGTAMVASEAKDGTEPADLKRWELRCYAPLAILLTAVATWRFCKYVGHSLFLPSGFVETESGTMDVGQFLFVSMLFLAVVIANDFAVSSAAAQSGGSLPVHPACLVCLSECAKAIVTLMIWLGNGRPINDKRDSNVDKQDSNVAEDPNENSNAVLCTVGLMLIPASIYTLNNMLSLCALARIHIAHIAVLRPTGVAVFNCVLWLAVFGHKKPISSSWGLAQKLLGLLLCLGGGFINSYDFQEGSLVLAPQAALMLLSSTFLSAFGAVTNEFVLKYRIQLNIDFQNLCLYCMTLSLSLGVLFGLAQVGDLHKVWTSSAVRVVICYNAVMGLAVSRVLKKMGSLSKMVLGIVREPFEVVVAPFFVVSELTPAVLGSAVLTVAGGLLYFLPPGALQRTTSTK